MSELINLYGWNTVIKKVDIISGFLGAGKTRFIKKLINDDFYEDKIVIIENEFGEVNIDSSILKKSKAVIKEITAGCICCEITGYFKEALMELNKNYEFECIIIEPTGIAKLSEIIKTFKDEDLKAICNINNVITIVDCLKFDIYMNNFRRFYIDQIKYAQLIVLSRIQLADKNTVNHVKNEIIKINSNAEILDCIWDETNLKDKINSTHMLQNFPMSKISLKNIKSGIGRISTKKVNESFQSFTLKLNRKISPDELSSKFKFIASSKNFGTILRAKGIVQLLNGQYGQFDFSLNEYNIETIDYNEENIISFIGVNINKKELEYFFK